MTAYAAHNDQLPMQLQPRYCAFVDIVPFAVVAAISAATLFGHYSYSWIICCRSRTSPNRSWNDAV